MRSWRLIHSGALNGAMNMALDEALYEAVSRGDSPPLVRLYRWQPATVTLGYAQRDPSAVNFAACRDYGFDVVRRSTGGRAVLHQHEVTYALIAPLDEPLFSGGILESYRAIAKPLQSMLASLGVDAELVPARRSTRVADIHEICFTAPASYELAVNGQKIAGSAQKRNDRAFLQHGSVPVELDVDVMARVLGKAGRTDQTASVRLLSSKVGWINRYLAQPVTLPLVEEAMASAFREAISGAWQLSEVSATEWQRAEQLYVERFHCPEWRVGAPHRAAIDPPC